MRTKKVDMKLPLMNKHKLPNERKENIHCRNA